MVRKHFNREFIQGTRPKRTVTSQVFILNVLNWLDGNWG